MGGTPAALPRRQFRLDSSRGSPRDGGSPRGPMDFAPPGRAGKSPLPFHRRVGFHGVRVARSLPARQLHPRLLAALARASRRRARRGVRRLAPRPAGNAGSGRTLGPRPLPAPENALRRVLRGHPQGPARNERGHRVPEVAPPGPVQAHGLRPSDGGSAERVVPGALVRVLHGSSGRDPGSGNDAAEERGKAARSEVRGASPRAPRAREPLRIEAHERNLRPPVLRLRRAASGDASVSVLEPADPGSRERRRGSGAAAREEVLHDGDGVEPAVLDEERPDPAPAATTPAT